MERLGIYIHIPFCKSKCFYCDFNSYANHEELVGAYVDALKKEINNVSDNREVPSVYIGGGTPSYIDAKYITEILEVVKNRFNVENDAEITIEVNPGTIDENKLNLYKKVGINRISFGLQACQNRLLKSIGRIHTYEEAKNGYLLARKCGFNNISLDLMFGLPEQSMDDLKYSLEKIMELKPEHVSTYSLKVEENTVFGKLQKDGNLVLPDEELEREMYYCIKNELKKVGYEHYEISNFAKIGHQSRHNNSYWEGQDYLGFGAGASSLYKNTRRSNENDIEKYIEKILNTEKVFEIEEELDEKAKLSEAMILGLRKLNGVSKIDIKEKLGYDIMEVYFDEITKLLRLGLLFQEDDRIRLTDKGLDLANQVFMEFV